MSYNSATVAKIIDQINRTYFLPAIQRPYVWEPDQIVALFDSLLKGYPISSFLFWELRHENRRNWEIYKFVEQFRYGEVHNEEADPDGRDFVLVLDGQQRLTSLLIGLRGSYTIKLKHKRWDNPSAWVKQRLYIDLFKDPGSDDEEDREDLGITYGLKFAAEQPQDNQNHLWFKIGMVLDFDDEEAFHSFVDDLLEKLPEDITRGQEKIARRTLENLYRKLWKDEVVAYYTEKNQSYDRVLDIFIRANDGGTKLSKSDLLLSMITSKWDGVNAREEIYCFVERLNNELNRKNNLDKDFVMRSCLVVAGLDHVYKVNNFTNEALATIQKKWPEIRAALEATIRLVNYFGIDRDNLTSLNALLPIAYYLSKIGASLDGSTAFEATNRERIRRWLLGALLNNVFGGNSDQTIGIARQIIKDAMPGSRDFPYAELCDGLLKRRGRVVGFDNNNLEALLDTRYTQRTCFLALSVLYDEHNWGSALYHIDHIIPRSLCTKNALQGRGLSEAKIEEIVACVDRLSNLQLLPGRENSEKSNLQFGDWIKTRDGGFLDRHLIPPEPHLWCPEALLEFSAAREELIRKRLASFASVLVDSSTGDQQVGESHPATA
jgi:uncharacterized protein with ParB-like and HNH nuclease domain